jgi:hypothetical protein
MIESASNVPPAALNRACRAERSGRRSARQTALGREPRGAARAPLAFRGTSLDHLDPICVRSRSQKQSPSNARSCETIPDTDVAKARYSSADWHGRTGSRLGRRETSSAGYGVALRGAKTVGSPGCVTKRSHDCSLRLDRRQGCDHMSQFNREESPGSWRVA